MLIIYFLLGLGITTAHSDYGVSYRAQNFDKTVRNIDKEAFIKHQREKRFVTEYFVPHNETNRPNWGNNSSRDFVANVTIFQYGNRPSGYNGVIPNTDTENVIPNTDIEEVIPNTDTEEVIPNTDTEEVIPNTDTEEVIPNTDTEEVIPNTDTEEVIPNTDTEEASNNHRIKRLVAGYFAPQNRTNKPTWGNLNVTRNHTTLTGPSNNSRNTVAYEQKFVNPGQNYNTNVTWPVYPTYNYIEVRPGYNINGNNTSNASGYTVPVNSVTPRNTPYPGYPGYPAPNTGYTVPNTGYPAPNTGYPTQNTVYPAPNTGYPASNTNPGQNYNSNTTRPVYPNYNNNIIVIPTNKTNFNNSYPSGYSVQPVNPARPGITRFPGYPGYPAPRTGYTVPNTVYPAPNTGYPTQSTVYPAPNTGYPASNTNPGQIYNTTRPIYPNYNNIIVRPTNKTNFNNSIPSGYNVQPVNPVTPGNTPYYPVPNTGYPASNTGFPASNTGNLAPNTWYPVPNTGYPAPNTGYRVPNTGYPASSVYPAPNNGYSAPSGYPVPNTFYPPPSSVIPPANVTGFVPKPNPGFTIHDAVSRNNTHDFNNDASSTNCKCNLPRANSTITKEERTMDACIITCNDCPAGMKMSAFGVCVKDLDYDDE